MPPRGFAHDGRRVRIGGDHDLDAGRIADRYKAKLDEWGVPYEEGGHTEAARMRSSVWPPSS